LGVSLDHVHVAIDGGVALKRRPCDHGAYYDLESVPIAALQRERKTVILVGTTERITGVIAVADEVRPEAQQTVGRLHELGVEHTVMLTGDNETTAQVVAETATTSPRAPNRSQS
jgi:Cd2+/Zn2+-exporting ATPase